MGWGGVGRGGVGWGGVGWGEYDIHFLMFFGSVLVNSLRYK